ncbi:type II toxin-antitoxin system ParD family antitoxin [Vibrio sp. SS-MA-C1-2]|uniref:type II toxin-antitoxin system ParD family antitoxin n=1 Tax=Vibrio sp. SS-MA-C1-2 TaxID=2908646 RepID=UPI001F1E44B8|nr:type II toxin-antitoxin system ParD family antitoxin [Vibrio sp. SS-MA-C1-2]UJF18559.1 type II toxin-antitoxin system ParD family antitoxin [Vibrio sp. SS-MA-C1-2]
MNRTTSVTIGESLGEFVERMIQSGRYNSTSEVMRCALKLLEEQENKLDLIRKELIAGEESGESSLTLKEIATLRKRKLNV